MRRIDDKVHMARILAVLGVNNPGPSIPMQPDYRLNSKKVSVGSLVVFHIGAPWSGRRSIAYFRLITYINGTPGICRMRRLSSRSQVAMI